MAKPKIPAKTLPKTSQAATSRTPVSTPTVPTGGIVTHADTVENYALWTTSLVALIAFVAAIIVNWGRESVPLVGDLGSMGAMTLIAVLIISVIIAPIAYWRGTHWRRTWSSAIREGNWYWRIVPVTIGAVLVSALLVIFGFVIGNAAFPMLHINPAAAPIGLAITSGAMTYFIARSFYFVRAPGLLLVVVIALMGTLLFAGALNDDPLWYEGSFSGLGMTESNSRRVFNIGLVITGLLLCCWAQFLTDDLSVLAGNGYMTAKSLNYIRILLVIAGIFLGMVGVVRWGIGPIGNLLRDLFAGGAGVALGIVLVGMYWFIPHFVKWFYYFSWGLLVLILISVIFKITGQVSLTGIEFIGFGSASLWLLIFMRSAYNLVNRIDPAAYTASDPTLNR